MRKIEIYLLAIIIVLQLIIIFGNDEPVKVNRTVTINNYIFTEEPTEEPIEEINEDISTDSDAEEKDISTSQHISEIKEEAKTPTYSEPKSTGVLTKSKGVNYNANGNKETYYNLNMSGVVNIMRNSGFSEEEYPYWVRDDGVKMLGDYVMVAASFSVHPRGSIVETSLGTGIVCDTGSFANSNPNQLDIAVDW